MGNEVFREGGGGKIRSDGQMVCVGKEGLSFPERKKKTDFKKIRSRKKKARRDFILKKKK